MVLEASAAVCDVVAARHDFAHVYDHRHETIQQPAPASNELCCSKWFQACVLRHVKHLRKLDVSEVLRGDVGASYANVHTATEVESERKWEAGESALLRVCNTVLVAAVATSSPGRISDAFEEQRRDARVQGHACCGE